MQETINWICSSKDEGCDDKAENIRDDGNYGCKEPNWKIKFSNIVDEEWGVKSSLKEELNNSMKSDEEGLTKDLGWVECN